MAKVNSREELSALRKKYRNNVIMRLVSDEAESRVEIRCVVGKCGIEAGARDIMKVIFDEVNAAQLEKVSVLVVDCSYGCDNADAPKIDGSFACGHDCVVDVAFPGEEPTRYMKVDNAKAKEIVGSIAARLEGKNA
jgi:NADP-reducing hydrogenase subunit HndB